MSSQKKSTSAQGNRGNNKRDPVGLPDPRTDQSFQHIGDWAPADPLDELRTRKKKGGKKKKPSVEEMSYQMSRFTSQQPKQEPWSLASKGRERGR